MKTLTRDVIRRLVRSGVRLAAATGPTEWSGIPRPTENATVHADGSNPLRLLLFGGGPSIGYGVTEHDLGLAGNFARGLSRRINRGVAMDVHIQKELASTDIASLRRDVDATRYDAIILTVGVQDAMYLDSATTWARLTRRLVSTLQSDTSTPLFIVGLPRFSDMIAAGRFAEVVLNRRVVRMNDELGRVSAEGRSVHYSNFERVVRQDDLKLHAVDTYRAWGTAMVSELAPGLAALDVPAGDEAMRQRALDDLHILDTPPEERFDRITEAAQRYFGTRGAAISLIDRDRQWFKSRRGFPRTQTSRALAICDYTIRSDHEFVVVDATKDPRFANNPLVATGPMLRSYAGWPIDSPSGEHVGALCVFDTVPREFTDRDLAFLRKLAALAQRELARPAGGA
jgi:hypothetical protein